MQFIYKSKRREYKYIQKMFIQPQRENKKSKEQKRNMNLNRKPRFKMVVNTSLSIITLNVVELNTPIKRHRVED